MAGLEGIDVTKPNGSEFLRDGDNSIRELKSMLKTFAELGHYLSGEHKFGVGPAADRPAAGKKGNLWVLTANGAAAELQYDTSSEWVALTRNQNVIDFMDALPDHVIADPIDHPDDSVTRVKIAPDAVGSDEIEKGSLLKKHLDGSTDVTSIAALVNGGNADTLHGHSAQSQLTLVASGSQTYNYTTYQWGVDIPIDETLLVAIETAAADTPKKYLVSARVRGETGNSVGTDDDVTWNIELNHKIISKGSYTAPHSGGGTYGAYADYKAQFNLTGGYQMRYYGGAGPTYVKFVVYYEIYEVN